MHEPLTDSPQLLSEGAWSKTKYWISKLGRLEKGGKIIGRGQQAQAAANQVADLLARETNGSLKRFDEWVRDQHPEFPNMESQQQFVDGCAEYAWFYDSVVGATQRAPEQEGFIPAVMANELIQGLRILFKHHLDYNLATVYQTMNEQEQPAGPISGADQDSETIKTLKSNKLPLLLTSLGSSLGAFGWILKSELMQNWLKSLLDHGQDAAQAINQSPVLNAIGSGEGITQFLHRLYPSIDISPGAPVANFQKVLAQVGGGNPDQGLKAISGVMAHPDKIEELKQMLASGKFKTMKELFNQAAGDPTSGRGGSWFETVKDAKMVTNLKAQLLKTVATKTVGAAATAAGLGSFLAPLGIGLVATGAAIKLLRLKGLKSSRAQVMNDLLQSWHLVPMEDAGSQALMSLGQDNQALQNLAKQAPQAASADNALPNGHGVGPRRSGFNSPASDIEDARLADDDEAPAPAPAAAQLGAPAPASAPPPATGPTAADPAPDGQASVTGAAPVAAGSSLLNRLNPEVNQQAQANLQAFGDTITSADKRSPEDIEDEILYLSTALKEIPTKYILPKVNALLQALKSGDPAKQLPALRGLPTLPAYIKNQYVQALLNYSEDTAAVLKRDMAYSAQDGLKKKQKPVADAAQLPLNEGYSTPLFDLQPEDNGLIMGSLASIGPKLIKLVQSGQPLTKQQIAYVVQQVSSGSYLQTRTVGEKPAGVAQKVIRAINKWLLVRINDYKLYLKYLQKQNGGKKPAPADPKAGLGHIKPEDLGEQPPQK